MIITHESISPGNIVQVSSSIKTLNWRKTFSKLTNWVITVKWSDKYWQLYIFINILHNVDCCHNIIFMYSHLHVIHSTTSNNVETYLQEIVIVELLSYSNVIPLWWVQSDFLSIRHYYIFSTWLYERCPLFGVIYVLLFYQPTNTGLLILLIGLLKLLILEVDDCSVSRSEKGFWYC